MADRLLTQAQDVSDHILVLVANVVEDWYPPGTPMPEEDLIDRLCSASEGEGWDIEDLDTPAVRKIIRHARAVRREMA